MAAQNKKELQEIKSLQQELNNILEKREESGEKVTRGLKKQVKLYDNLIEKGKEAVKDGTLSTKRLKDQAKFITEQVKRKDSIKNIDKQLAENAKHIENAKKGGYTKTLANLKAKRTTLEIDRKRIVTDSISADLKEKAKKSLMSQVVQGGLLVTAFMGLKKLAFAFAGKVDAIGKAFGVGGGGIQDALLQSEVEMTKFGLGLDEAISMTNVLSSGFGIGLQASANMAKEIASSAVGMGLTADEGATLFGILGLTANHAEGQAKKLAESAYHLATANDVAPQAVMKDIAANADFFAKHMKDGGKNVMEAAVQAKTLGLNLSTVEGIAGGLLDFQSSLNAEVEASIMLGRDINLQKARELALNDDLTGMMEEVVKQAGGEAEFNKLNRLERDAIAKAVGLSASQMAKVVGEHGKLETQRSFADIAGPDAIANLTKIINQVKSFGAVLLDKFGKPLEAVFEQFHAWMESGKGITSMTSFATSFIDKIANLPGIIKGIITIMIAWKAISLGVAAAQMAIAVGKSGAQLGLIGLGAGVVAAIAAWTAIKALPSFATLPPGMAATPMPGGTAMAHGAGNFGAETILHTDGIENRLDSLVNIIEAAWGFGGTAPKQMGKEFGSHVEKIQGTL